MTGCHLAVILCLLKAVCSNRFLLLPQLNKCWLAPQWDQDRLKTNHTGAWQDGCVGLQCQKMPPVPILHTCARWWQCWRPASLSRSLVHDEEQVLGLAELPSEPRKRHTGAACGEAEQCERRCDAARRQLASVPQWVVGVTLTVMTADEMVHWAHTGKCDGSWM